MKFRHCAITAIVTVSVAAGLVAMPQAVADPATPYPCDTEWLPPRPRTVCDDSQADTAKGPVGPDLPDRPDGPAGPGGPGGAPGPGGPR
jgi:hypothetical protein